MHLRKHRLFAGIGLLLILLCSTGRAAPLQGFCPFKAFDKLTQRYAALQATIEHKISQFVQSKSSGIVGNTKRPSWQGKTDEERLMQAAADSRKAIASAEEASKGSLRETSATRLADVLDQERVVKSGVELEVIGRGVGRYADYHPNFDENRFFDNLKGNIDHIGNTDVFSEAEAMRNLDRVVEMNIPGGKKATEKLHTYGDKKDLGPMSEVNSIYWLDQDGASVNRFEPEILDIDRAPLTTKIVDFEASNGLSYQNAATTNALTSKMSDSKKLGDTAAGILAVEYSKPGSFRFIGSKIDPESGYVGVALDLLNTALKELQIAKGIPLNKRIRDIAKADIVVKPFK